MLHVIRGIFVAVCSILGWKIGVEIYKIAWWQGLLFGFLTGFCCAILEMSFARRFSAIISVLMFGVVVGFVVSHFLVAALDLVLGATVVDWRSKLYRDLGITFVVTFLSVLTILHTKDDFKFVIPFVELRREGKTGRPMLLDTSAIIDGRIADVVETKIIDQSIIVPKFVLDELQAVADSQDKLKRNRGRRGLDILNRMRKARGVEIQIHDVGIPGVEGVDGKLVRLAKMLDARIVTNDFNLNKVAQVQGVDVININDLATALKPALLQGEKLLLKIFRTGESPGQGVGYLDDGTMVVAEECANRIGQVVELQVTNILQTSAGRLVFGRPAEEKKS